MVGDKKTVINLIVRLRYYTAKASRERESLWQAKEAMRVRAKFLKRQPGFVYSRELYEIEQGETRRDPRLDLLNEKLLEWGRILMNCAPYINSVLTFEEMCDVLNVNVAERRAIEPKPDIVSLVFACGLENSASTRKQDYKDTPLFNALHLLFGEFLATPSGQQAGDTLMREFFGVDFRKPDQDDDEDWRDAGPTTPKSPLVLH